MFLLFSLDAAIADPACKASLASTQQPVHSAMEKANAFCRFTCDAQRKCVPTNCVRLSRPRNFVAQSQPRVSRIFIGLLP